MAASSAENDEDWADLPELWGPASSHNRAPPLMPLMNNKVLSEDKANAMSNASLKEWLLEFKHVPERQVQGVERSHLVEMATGRPSLSRSGIFPLSVVSAHVLFLSACSILYVCYLLSEWLFFPPLF